MSTPMHPISDRAVSYLRTVVPVLWGSAVAWLLTVVVLPAEVTDLLSSDLAITAVTALAVGAWYIAWRWAEPRIPDWLTRLALGSAQTPVYVRDAEVGVLEEYGPPTSGTPPPSVGRVVRYESPVGDGVTSPAIILRTRSATVPGVIDRWGPRPDGTLSGVGRPDGLVPELPDDATVDLLVHGLGGDFREYAVPHGDGPGTWSWPPRT